MKAPHQHRRPRHESWAEANQNWIRWWSRHRDSGYIEDENGRARYNIHPHEAFSILKYQAEYHADRNLPFTCGRINGRPLPEFTFADFEAWARAQKKFEDAGGNRPVNQKEAKAMVGQ